MSRSPHIVRHRDFSGGELVEHAKRRDDEAVVRSGCRTLRNVRILSTGAVEQRPGRSAIFQEDGRVDKVRMSPTYSAYLCFGNGTLTIRNSSGTPVARAWDYDWATATTTQITWTAFGNDIVITFPGQVPKIARWDGGTEWTFLDWAADETSGGQKRVPFKRISSTGITLLPSARTGTINLTFSENVLVSGMVGTRLRFVNRQIEIATVTSGTAGTGTVKEPLPGSQVLTFGSDPRNTFALSEIVEGSSTGSKGYITALSATTMTVQLVTTATSTAVIGGDDLGPTGSVAFTTSDSVVGPGGGLTPSSVAAIGNPAAVPLWDEEVFNTYRGWPKSVSSDQNRLIFADFPAAPDGIAWSALLTPDDFYPGADPAEAIFETVPARARVYHVMEGADEFVFTDRGIYYVPISETTPLRPGSVAFRRVPGPAASAVRPVATGQGTVYVNNGLNRVLAIVGTGQTAMPWLVRPVSDLHSHLFEGITCLAFEEGDGDPPDEVLYAVNGDGTVAVGRYQPGKDWVGWHLWEGDGDVLWASAQGDEVVFSTSYTPGYVIERIDPDQYLDAAVSYDAIPSALGTGAQTAVLLPDDQGTTGGDMTANGGVAAARDGTTSQAAAACAAKASVNTAYIFVRFGQKMRIAKADAYPSNDQGFTTSASNIAIQLRGYDGASDPSSATDGTLLAQVSSGADLTTMQTITSGDTATEWDGVIVNVGCGGAASTMYLAEIRIYTPGVTHGSGELWYLDNATVDIMDGRRVVGTGSVDANGEITSTATITDQQIGFGFDVTIEPFMPHLQGGQSADQTMAERQIGDGAVAVQNSTGFTVQSYKKNGGTWDDAYVRSAYNTTDDEDSEPTAREEVVKFKVHGADHDPRIRIVKDYPGPLRVLEIGVKIDS